MIERLFRLSENETSTCTEVLAGVTAFLTMAYISGRGREISWLTYVLAIVLVLYFVFVRSQMG